MATEPVKPISNLESLACYLHKKFCSWNHVDGCSWFYEQHWVDYAHKVWLKNAKQLLEEYPNA